MFLVVIEVYFFAHAHGWIYATFPLPVHLPPFSINCTAVAKAMPSLKAAPSGCGRPIAAALRLLSHLVTRLFYDHELTDLDR